MAKTENFAPDSITLTHFRKLFYQKTTQYGVDTLNSRWHTHQSLFNPFPPIKPAIALCFQLFLGFLYLKKTRPELYPEHSYWLYFADFKHDYLSLSYCYYQHIHYIMKYGKSKEPAFFLSSEWQLRTLDNLR